MSGLFPRNDKFFDLFDSHAKLMQKAATCLIDITKPDAIPDQIAETVRGIERDADKITRDSLKTLARSFITPIDREDIHAVVSALDDVIDFIDDAANCYALFKVSEPFPAYIDQVKLLVDSTAQLNEAISYIRSPKTRVKARALVFKVYDSESKGDYIYNHALATLFNEGSDCVQILKWKEICSFIEDALDKCQELANTIEMIVLKS